MSSHSSDNDLRLVGAINVLAEGFVAIYNVNVQTGEMSVYRSAHWEESGLDATAVPNWADAVSSFVNGLVHPQDRARVLSELDLRYACERLATDQRYVVHCRVSFKGDHYYRIVLVRDGEADFFKNIIVSAACEDDDISTSQIYESQMQALLVKASAGISYYHFDLEDDRLLSFGGTSHIPLGANAEGWLSVNEVVEAISGYIPLEGERESFLRVFSHDELARTYREGDIEDVQKAHVACADGIARICKYKARLIMNPRTAHLEAVLYARDVTKSVTSYDTQASIVQSLSRSYRVVLAVNTHEGSAAVIKGNDFPSEYLDDDFHPYDRLMRHFAETLVMEEDRPAFLEATALEQVIDRLSRNEEYTGSFRIAEGGGVRYNQFRLFRNEESGLVALGILDIDDAVAAEAEHRARLEEALDGARAASRAKSSFLACMSHDIRTPLNGIIGLLQIDEQHADDVALLAENRKKSKVAASHLLSLVNDVLDMSKIEDGGLVVSHEPIDLYELMSEISVLARMQASDARIDYRSNVSPEAFSRRFVYASPLHLRRVFTNILGNCTKYNKEHGSVRVEVEDLSDICALDGACYRWTIADTGIGMAPEFLEHIFEPFSQEKIDARSVYHGTGLGMPIAKSLVEQMGGSLEVTSELGRGTRFIITVPFDVADEAAVRPLPQPSTAQALDGVHVLLVEDNELNREIAETVLNDRGARVTSAVNGAEAVEVFEGSAPGEFDVILMDVMMPVLNGYDATKRIRELSRPDAREVPIIAMTANAFAEDVQRALESGMNAHIAKPLDMRSLVSTIVEFTQRARAGASAFPAALSGESVTDEAARVRERLACV